MGKKVLLIYANEYFLTSPVYPFGLDIIAQHLRENGHTVCINLPFLRYQDTSKGIETILNDFQPDIAGISIRNIDTAMACDSGGTFQLPGINTHFFLPGIARIITVIKKNRPDLPVVCGGTGFSVSPESILEYVGGDFGIISNAARPMLMFVNFFPDLEKVKSIPNLISQQFDVSKKQSRSELFTEFDLLPIEKSKDFNHSFETIGIPVMTSYGCCMNCSYCVEPKITKNRFIQRPKKDIVNELVSISEKKNNISEIFFVNTEFNIPDPGYSLALLKDIIKNQLHKRFRFSSQFLPIDFSEEYVNHLSRAGFYVILTCDSFFDDILKKNNSPYREKHILNTLDLFEKFNVQCTLNLIFGLPGETFDSINHTLSMIRKYAVTGLFKFEYTVGARIYNNTALAKYIENNNQEANIFGNISKGYTEPLFFSSPASPLELNKYIEPGLPFKQHFKPFNTEDNRIFRKTIYDADQGHLEKACHSFLNTGIQPKALIYDYLFRKLTDCGENKLAKKISIDFITTIQNKDRQGLYTDRIPMIQYFLSLL